MLGFEFVESQRCFWHGQSLNSPWSFTRGLRNRQCSTGMDPYVFDCSNTTGSLSWISIQRRSTGIWRSSRIGPWTTFTCPLHSRSVWNHRELWTNSSLVRWWHSGLLECSGFRCSSRCESPYRLYRQNRTLDGVQQTAAERRQDASHLDGNAPAAREDRGRRAHTAFFDDSILNKGGQPGRCPRQSTEDVWASLLAVSFLLLPAVSDSDNPEVFDVGFNKDTRECLCKQSPRLLQLELTVARTRTWLLVRVLFLCVDQQCGTRCRAHWDGQNFLITVFGRNLKLNCSWKAASVICAPLRCSSINCAPTCKFTKNWFLGRGSLRPFPIPFLEFRRDQNFLASTSFEQIWALSNSQ